ncbi:unnamed protein product [Lactuca virosa]|uniref:Uncharacterized protein n=1 Tax=Lactuca virosa TaxID=75947 RepID=A0AAU9LED5_9ASTR|nr:unnamed protein product [Lactuca virosa]
MKSIGNPHERVDERIRSGKPLSKATIDVVDAQLLDQAHLYVLRNTAVVEPYIEQHMLELKDLNPRHARKSTWLQSQHSRAFISWFKKEVGKRLANGEDICDDVRWLAKGPNFVVSKYSGFAINEYHFHTTSRDESRTTQCSGVSLVAHTMQIASAKDANPVNGAVTYFDRVPVGKEAIKLSTFEGLVARTMVPITYESWLEVSDEVKEGLWQYVLEKFVVDPKSQKQTLQSIGKKWRNFKHYLYAKFIKNRSKDPKANLFKPSKDYPFIKKEDWKVFVSHRVTKKWEMQETGKTEEEIDRKLLWKKAKELKRGGYKSDVKMIVDKFISFIDFVILDNLLLGVSKLTNKGDELQKSESFGEVTCGTHDVLTEALGTQEQRGRVRGMDENIKVMMEIFLQGEALIPIPLEEEFIVKGKVVASPVKKHATPLKKDATPVKEDATPLKEEIGSNKKEKGTGKMGDEKKEPCDLEEGNDMEEGNGIEKKRLKRRRNKM